MSRLPKTISVEKLDNSVLFTFAQNQHYLYDGTIEVPFNSLSIIADKSEAITLRKSASNDIFISAPWENFDINASNKEDVVDALTDMLYDETGGGVSREEVEDMIDAATSGIPSSQTIEALRTDVNTISGNVQTLSGEVATKADASDLQALSEKVDTKLDASAYTPTDLSEYWTSAETKSYVDGKVDDALDDYYDKDYVDAALADKLDASAYTPVDLSEYWTSAETQNAINAATSGIPSSQVIEALRTDVNTISGDVQSLQDDVNSVWDTIDEKEEVVASALTELNLRLNEDEEVTAAALNDLNSKIGSGGGALFVDYQDLIDNMNDDKWDELVNALQNKKPIFYGYDYSEGDITDAGQSPVDGYVYINQTEGEETTEISLKQLNGGGYYAVTIIKNGSEDYEVIDEGFDFQPMLQAGSGISIDENNVISVTADSELDETSNNPVANSAVTNVIIDDEEVISRAINELNDRLVAVESGGSSQALEYYSEDTSGNTANIHIEDAENSTQGDLFVYADGTQMTGTRNDSDEDIVYSANINVAPESIDITYEKGTGDETTDAHSYLYVNENNISLEVYSNEVTTTLEVNDNGVLINNDAVVTESQLSGYQPILSAGTGIEISGNVISATGGGGATYSAGTNISIDTANTINCTLPLRAAGSNNTSIKQSTDSSIGSNASLGAAFGLYNSIGNNTYGAFVSGYNVRATKNYEAGFGHFNNSVTGSTASGQTLFSVGNGQYHAEHNAFEIRENGDIYIASGNTDIKLQDHLGGGSSVTVDASLDSGSTNPVANSAITNALDAKADASTTYTKTEVNNLVNNKFWCGTQAQYDALATKENDVLYLIHN